MLSIVMLLTGGTSATPLQVTGAIGGGYWVSTMVGGGGDAEIAAAMGGGALGVTLLQTKHSSSRIKPLRPKMVVR